MYRGWVDGGTRYLTKTTTFDEGGSVVENWSKPYDADLVPTSPPDYQVVKSDYSFTTSTPHVGTPTITYSDPVDETAQFEEGIAAALDFMAANWETISYDPTFGGARVYFDEGGGGPFVEVTANRYRWRIPSTFTSAQPFRGSYAKVIWDVIRVPNPSSGPYAENPDVSFAAEGLEWEWIGSGLEGEPDDPSWLSGWYDYNAFFIPPWTASTTAFVIVNARWDFYRTSRLGKKQHWFGSRWQPPV